MSLRVPAIGTVWVGACRGGVSERRTTSAPSHRLDVPVRAHRVDFCTAVVCAACGYTTWTACYDVACGNEVNARRRGVPHALKADRWPRFLRGRKHYESRR